MWDTVPDELVLRQLLPRLDTRSMAATAQTSSRFRDLVAQLVHTVKLLEQGSLPAALASRHMELYTACRSLEVCLRVQTDAQQLRQFLDRTTRHWPQLHTLTLRSQRQSLVLLAPLRAIQPSITQLYVHFDIKPTTALLDTLGTMTQLTALHLQLLGGPHDLAPLAQLTQLQQLHVGARAGYSYRWLPSSLRHLTIASGIGRSCHTAWADAIRGCAQLRSLTLHELGEFDPPGMLNLSHCTQLTRLDGTLVGACASLTGLPASLKVLQLTGILTPGLDINTAESLLHRPGSMHGSGGARHALVECAAIPMLAQAPHSLPGARCTRIPTS